MRDELVDGRSGRIKPCPFFVLDLNQLTGLVLTAGGPAGILTHAVRAMSGVSAE